MSLKIKFDSNNLPENPTLLLANRSGDKFGQINAKNIVVKDCMKEASEISFKVYKYLNGTLDILWNKIKDFKLVYCVEMDMWFEATVTIDESNETIKNVSCVQLGRAELSQIYLYNIEINTENDISRDNYSPTVLYDEENPTTSLLDRITEKARHYHFIHVDSSIAKIQRTFSFDGITIEEAFNKIEEEIGCIFIYHSNSDENGKMRRDISVFDLETNCSDCGYRGEFNDKCPECGSKNIVDGYGQDTTIFVTSDELGKNISFQSDVDSVKNYFRLEAGDDDMTATIKNCNPNGSSYIWYLSDELKEDMPSELVDKISEYNKLYSYYENEYLVEIEEELINDYNKLVDKYGDKNPTLEKIPSSIVGYSNLILSYYKIIDMIMYLQSEMLPSVELSSTSAIKEASKLTAVNLSPISVENINIISSATADNAVLSVAKCIVNANYQVKVNSSVFDNLTWTGNFKVTNYSDDEDYAISDTISIVIDNDYSAFVRQKIQKVLVQDKGDITDVSSLFDTTLDKFKIELKKYSLDYLKNLWDICQSCLDTLIQQGVSDKKSWSSGSKKDVYDEVYIPYYNKLKAIESEQYIREQEIEIVDGKLDIEGELIKIGIKNKLEEVRNVIQNTLNFEKYLGIDLWMEFIAYRREDTYSNSNYISDGLNNSQLFEKALDFIEVAKKEIYKSSELQHSISATLQNLMTIKKFEILTDYFEVGNWIRVQIDDKVYKLRLLDFEIDFDNLEDISVTFSDVLKIADGFSDQESLLKQTASMATSYDYVQRQANQSVKTRKQVDNWVYKGLELNKMKIIDNADNQNITWDSHGLLFKEWLPITSEYSDKQLKIINKGLFLTDDNWVTSRTGIGNFIFYNPKTGEMEESYGVIADTLVGNLILSEEVGIYNKNNSITLDEYGLTITSYKEAGLDARRFFTLQKKTYDNDGNEVISPIAYLDNEGELVLNGSVKINSVYGDDGLTIDYLFDENRTNTNIDKRIATQLEIFNDTVITQNNQLITSFAEELENYKADIGQYLSYNDDGLILGATSSSFKTVIDNKGLYFKESNNVVAYINNNQLHIPDAIIENTLTLGKFIFTPRGANGDKGTSLIWKG